MRPVGSDRSRYPTVVGDVGSQTSALADTDTGGHHMEHGGLTKMIINPPKSRIYTVRLERPEGTLMFDADENEYLLYSMVDAAIDTPYICEQGWCLACAARLTSGEVDRQDALTLYPDDIAAGFVLLCSTKPRSDLVLVQDERQTRREMTQHRIERNQLARAYPPGARARFRRGRAKTNASTEK